MTSRPFTDGELAREDRFDSDFDDGVDDLNLATDLDDGTDLVDGTDREDADYTSPTVFDTDTGLLTAEQRYALVCLLADRYVSPDTNLKAWRVIVRDQELLRSRLNELFLELVIDKVREVARKAQIPNEDGIIDGYRTLLRSATRSLEETFLLAHARMRYHRGVQRGELRVMADRDELVSDLMRYIKVDAGNQSAPKKRAARAVDTLVTERVLIDRGEDRYEIHPVVETLISTTAVRNLVDHFREQRRIANHNTTTPDSPLLPDPDPTETDELLNFDMNDEGDPT
jgi:hypothetical protein